MVPMRMVLFVIGALVLPLTAQAQALRVGTTESQKLFAPLVRDVLAEAGHDSSFVVLPLARLYVNLASGDLDLAFFLSDAGLAQVSGSRKVPVPLYSVEMVAVSVAPGIEIASLTDLGRYKVGIVRGNKLQEDLTRRLPDVFATETEESQFRMLAAGRLDVAIVPRPLVAAMTRAIKLDTYRVHEPPVATIPLYLALSGKVSEAVARNLGTAFRRVVENGSWAAGVKGLEGSMR